MLKLPRCGIVPSVGAVLLICAQLASAQETTATVASAETSSPLEMLLSIDPNDAAPRNSEGDIIKLSDGRLALVYTKFAGGTADHSRAHLAMRTSDDMGRSWSGDKTIVPNEGGQNVMSVSMLPSRDNGILLFYLRKDTAGTSCALFVRRSYDDLATLSDAVQVTTLPGYHVVNNDRVIRLTGGRLLAPSALHTDPATTGPADATFSPKGAMVVYYSDDDGATWQRDQMPVKPMTERKIMLQEPGMVELADGRVLMYIRTDQGHQFASWSDDRGETWSQPAPMELASPRSPATIERIPGTGRLVAVWNDHSGRWPFSSGNRTPLCIAVSADGGKNWSDSQMLEPDPNGWFCYTSMTFTPDDLLLSYCAGQGRRDGLNRLKVSRLPLDWVKSLR